MTTPERLRRRQRLESAGLAVLALGLVASVIWTDRQDAQQGECIRSFIEADSETGAIRSQLVEDESQANREVIGQVLASTTREEIDQAEADWRAELDRIDAVRAANPVRPFPVGVCD